MSHQHPSLPFHSEAPLRICVRRAGAIESVHLVDIALADPTGKLILAMGGYEDVIFPRSAMKPLQAIAVTEWLQDEKSLTITDEELALFCASHNGEPFHSQQVKNVLAKFAISPHDLICAGHWSLDQQTLISQARQMDHPDNTHNNCSGKHAGMLILAKLLTGSTDHYEKISHACQQRILGILEAMTGCDLMTHTTGIDGCGAPVYSAPLGNWARAFALFADGDTLPETRQAACQRLRHAIASHPDYIAGQNRACTAINRAYGKALTVKVGAEGVYSAAFHDLGLGLMLKVRDGNRRGAEAALGAVIAMLGIDIPEDLRLYFTPELTNWAGTPIGDITVAYPS